MINKLTTVLLSVIVVASFGLIQQIHAQSPVDFGIKGGLNFATLADSDEDLDYRTGVHAGLVLDFSFPMFPVGIESGIYYSQRGAKFFDDAATVTLKLDYIEVPVLAKVNVGPPGPFSPHIVVGPFAAYNINSKLEVSGTSDALPGDYSDFTSAIDFGGVIGLGTDISMGVTKLNIQARYSRGLTNIYDNSPYDEEEYNSVFLISAGIMF